MKKVVDGVSVDMTDEEQAERFAEEAQWLQEKATQEAEAVSEVERAALIESAISALIKERAAQPNPPKSVAGAAKIL